MITHVKLRQWKTHLQSNLQFGEGTNALVGMMGAGKSAVLEAIAYALFGTLPRVQMRRIRLDDLIMNRPRPMDSAEVEVGFVAPDGNEYVVKRIIERGSGTTFSELRKANGELIESPSATRVNEMIQSLLKLDYDLFERAIYSEQNRLDYFLILPRGKRMESIDELLGIDKLELVRKNVGNLAHRVNGRIDDRQAALNQLKQDVTLTTLPALEQGLKEIELSKQEVQARLGQLQPELDAVQTRLQRLREMEQKSIQLDKSLGELEGAVSAIKHQLDQTKGKLGAAVEVGHEELQQQVADLEQACNEAFINADVLNSKLTVSSSRIRELEAKIGMFHDRLKKLSSEIARRHKSREELEQLKLQELVKLIEELQKKIRSTSDELAACRARMQDLQQALSELMTAGPTCPVCDSPLPEDKKQSLLKEREQQLEALHEQATQLEAHLSQLNEDLQQKLELQRRALLLAKEVEDLPTLEAERSQLEQQLRSLEEELISVRAEVEKLRSDVDNSRREAERLREQLLKAKQTLQLRLDLNQLELEHKRKLAESLRIQRGLWQLRRMYDEAQIKMLEKRFEKLIRAHEHLKTELIGKEQVIEERRRLIENIRQKQDTLTRYEVELKFLRQALEALQTIQTALARTQTALRRDFIEAVNGAMNELWEDIYPYGDFTGIRLAVEGGERGDYVLQLRDRLGSWIPVEGIASGGERTCACLALRIAFAVVLAPALSWLVLDEPTHNLDAEGIQELATALRERVPEIVRQVLLITHEERLEAAVSGYLYRFSRDKDTDQPTRIEQAALPELA